MILDDTRSIRMDVRPFLVTELAERGYAIIKLGDRGEGLDGDMLLAATLLGEGFGDTVSHRTLSADGHDEVLAAHCEGISFTKGLVPVFALGCSTAAKSGGETRVYDGRKAARLVLERFPKLASARVRYESLGNVGEGHEYPLVVEDGALGKVLRYRGRVETNRLPDGLGLPEEEFYQSIDAVLAECIAVTHKWERGDVLFVDNRWTLHDRLPFVGHRRMLRIRYGDTAAPGLRY